MGNRFTHFFSAATLIIAGLLIVPQATFAAGSIGASGGGTKTVGQQFTVTVTASGVDFDSLQGTISISGPVSVVSFSAGNATWLPGKTPGNNQQFVGITNSTNSLKVATIVLKGTKEGSGSVSISGVKLAKAGAVVSTSGGATSFSITRAPTPPGKIDVRSSTHPDQNALYEDRNVSLSWERPSGVTEFSYLLDSSSGTTPAAQASSNDTSVTYTDKEVGTYYFHIRGKNGDGWGATTHYKVSIKEPDPKIDPALAKPAVLTITKEVGFATNLETGTVSGIMLGGTSTPGFTITLSASPTLTAGDGSQLTTEVDAAGYWSLPIRNEVKAGFYSLTVQGKKDKTLTPISDTVRFELALADGGNATFITATDAVPTATPTPDPTKPTISAAPSASPTAQSVRRLPAVGAGLAAAALLFIIGYLIIRHRYDMHHADTPPDPQ